MNKALIDVNIAKYKNVHISEWVSHISVHINVDFY